jgi:hypothetical protein
MAAYHQLQVTTGGAQASAGPALQALLLALHLQQPPRLAQRWLLLVMLQLQAKRAAQSCYGQHFQLLWPLILLPKLPGALHLPGNRAAAAAAAAAADQSS